MEDEGGGSMRGSEGKLCLISSNVYILGVNWIYYIQIGRLARMSVSGYRGRRFEP